MVRIGRYKYPVNIEDETNLDYVTNAFFVIRFECNNKAYVDWTGMSNKTVALKLEELISSAFNSRCSSKLSNNPGLRKAFIESKCISVRIVKVPSTANSLLSIYKELYRLIDTYSSYAPNGYNLISGLNKSTAEKMVIEAYANKWHISDTSSEKTGKGYSGKPVYQYRKISEGIYLLDKMWKSIREYSDSVLPKKINPSAIYMCCAGQRRVAYGSIWRFNNDKKVIELNSEKKNQSLSTSQQESLAEKQLKFITKNQN